MLGGGLHILMLHCHHQNDSALRWAETTAILMRELRSCVKVEVAAQGSLSLMVAVDVKQHFELEKSEPKRCLRT